MKNLNRYKLQTELLLALSLAPLLGGCPPAQTNAPERSGTGQGAVPGDNGHLLLGNPSNAGYDADNFLQKRPQFIMSYNRAQGGPNWVSWHLQKSDLGQAKRGDFHPDEGLPIDWQIRPSDYRGSGYDRGHVCPSGDRTNSREDNDATFAMSNMLPQTAALNQHIWKDLEDYARSLVRKNELYVVAGGVGSIGRIGKGKVNIPKQCWKVLVVLPTGNNDLTRIKVDTRVIAVMMPNQESEAISNAHWSKYATSIAQIEKVTGYNLLSALPDEIEKVLEEKVDSGRAPR
jgi:endonuclease G